MVKGRVAFVCAFVFGGAGCAALVDLGDPKQQMPTDGGDAEPNLQAQAIAVGARHACAVVSGGPGSPENGTIRCWGGNDSGQLGVDPAMVSSSYVPLAVEGRDSASNEQAGASALALGSAYSCTVTADGYLLCWGAVPGDSHVDRQDGTDLWKASQMWLGNTQFDQVASASVTTTGGCATQTDMSLVCWGADLAAATDSDGGVTMLDGGVSVTSGISAVAVGRAHACAIVTVDSGTNDVACWGANDHGQAGAWPSADAATPRRLGLDSQGNVAAVAAGGDDSCALLRNGQVYCWGAGDRGQVGPAMMDSSTPFHVDLGGHEATALAMGDAHACAVLDDTTVTCWGDDSSAQLGGDPVAAGYSATPVPTWKRMAGHPLKAVSAIAAGGGTTCITALEESHVFCWGANDEGQAGQPNTGAPVLYAQQVPW